MNTKEKINRWSKPISILVLAIFGFSSYMLLTLKINYIFYLVITLSCLVVVGLLFINALFLEMEDESKDNIKHDTGKN